MSGVLLPPKRDLSPPGEDLQFDVSKRLRLVAANDDVAQLTCRPQPLSASAATAETTVNSRESESKTNAAGKKSKKRRKKQVTFEPGSRDDIFWHETIKMLGRDTVQSLIEAGADWDAPFHHREEVELLVSCLSSNGEGLAVAPSPKSPWLVIVPFALPGERVRARVYRSSRLFSFADLLGIDVPNNAIREMDRVRCRYFGICGGCQFQMLSYDHQLDLKRNVIANAYETFSDIKQHSIPEVSETLPSPMQYGYRTKITPHFDAPQKRSKSGKDALYNFSLVEDGTPEGTTQPSNAVKIGFNKAGTHAVIDIEECPIATGVLNDALVPLRDSVRQKWHTYKKGASLLLRESITEPSESKGGTESRTCITDHRVRVRERVGDILFEYPAGSFFQNNNSVLPSLVMYVSDTISRISSNVTTPMDTSMRPTHLVDAYCGCGLFSLSLARHFDKIVGIEVSADSIASAKHNAELNGLSHKVEFRVGDASHIFDVVKDFPSSHTVVIVDPPRKGCGEDFLKQLLLFRGAIIVYVSCNVHTQARDVGFLLNQSTSDDKVGHYELLSLQGFDLFPQTAHVESVAVLRLMLPTVVNK